MLVREVSRNPCARGPWKSAVLQQGPTVASVEMRPFPLYHRTFSNPILDFEDESCRDSLWSSERKNTSLFLMH